MAKHDPAEYLPTEMFQQILSYLEAADLARSSATNKTWKTYASEALLWQRLCRERWQGKRYMRRAYRIGDHPPREQKQTKLICKASKLWEDNPEKWKWAYGAVEVEAVRSQTTESEIVESYWKFTYTNGLWDHNNYPIFEANHTLIQPDIFSEPLTWNLLPGGYFIVSRLPPLYISRNRSTWAWTISNAFCLYVAVEHPGMETKLFGGVVNDWIGEDEECGMDIVDEVEERKGAMPRRGDGGVVLF